MWANSTWIVQTLTNLLSDAIKFSPANNTVWLTVHQQDDEVLVFVYSQTRAWHSADSRRYAQKGMTAAIASTFILLVLQVLHKFLKLFS